MLKLFRAELTKIRRSLIFLAILAIPLMVFGVLTLGLSNVDEQVTWQLISDGVTNFWAYFLLPLSVTVLTALMGQIEHRHNTWTYALIQPQPKWMVFIVKGMVTMLIMLLVTVLIMGATFGAGYTASLINPDQVILGSLPVDYLWRKMFRVWEYSFLLVAIQFWVAMRFGGMAVPLLFGIGGMIFTVVAAATSMFGFEFLNDDYLPWLMPANGLSAVAAERQIGLLVGGVGGIALFLLASMSLARKDWN